MLCPSPGMIAPPAPSWRAVPHKKARPHVQTGTGLLLPIFSPGEGGAIGLPSVLLKMQTRFGLSASARFGKITRATAAHQYGEDISATDSKGGAIDTIDNPCLSPTTPCQR
jgi:hypothetical protein